MSELLAFVGGFALAWILRHHYDLTRLRSWIRRHQQTPERCPTCGSLDGLHGPDCPLGHQRKGGRGAESSGQRRLPASPTSCRRSS